MTDRQLLQEILQRPTITARLTGRRTHEVVTHSVRAQGGGRG